jgi:hypothetical protein
VPHVDIEYHCILLELSILGFHTFLHQHTEVLDKLIQMVTTTPVLGCPDLEQQYFLKVEASVFTLGAVLFQYDDQWRQHDVAYLSKVLTPPEQNYDIWD